MIPPRLAAVRVSVPAHVVRRDFEAETVVLDLEAGAYYGLNPTAGRMLEVLELTGAVVHSLEQLAAEFELPADQLAEDLCRFCEELAGHGLIELA